MTTEQDDQLEAILRNIELRKAVPEVARKVRYRQQLVAFLDILGWKELIEKSVRSTAALGRIASIQMSAHLDRTLQEIFDEDELSSKETHFSDSIAMSWKYPRQRKYRTRIVFDLACIVREYFRIGVLIRGGLTKGLLVHGNDIVFGPSLIEAYQLESKHARFPRVLVAEPLAKVLLADYQAVGGPNPPIMRDSDGHVFLNFLSIDRQNPEWPFFMSKVRIFILEGLGHEKPDVREKYEWLGRYFNRVRADAALTSVSGVEALTIDFSKSSPPLIEFAAAVKEVATEARSRNPKSLGDLLPWGALVIRRPVHTIVKS